MTIDISKLIPLSKILLIGLICFHCAGKKSADFTPDLIPEFEPELHITLEPSTEVIDSVPDWYTDIPVKEGFRYQVGTAVTIDVQTAGDHAESYASHNLAQELESEISSELNNALDQIGKSKKSFLGKALKRAGKKIISRHVDDYAIVEKEILEEDSDFGYIYRAYILIEWDEGPAQQELLDKIKEHDKVYARMGPTDLLEKMEVAVAAYNQKEK